MPGSCLTVMPSTPGAPLLRTTARNGASMVSDAQIASMRCSASAGLSGSAVAVIVSTSCASRPAASPRPGFVKASSSWYGGRVAVMRRPIYSPFPSTPSRGPFGPSAAFLEWIAGLVCPLLTSASRSDRLAAASVPKDTTQISRSKPDSLHRTPAGFTVLALFDGYGLREWLPARPTSTASYPISVRRVATLLHASFRQSLAVLPLRFASASPPSGCTGDFHPQTAGHVRHTAWLFEPPPKAAAGLTSPRQPDLLLPSVRRPDVPTLPAISAKIEKTLAFISDRT